MDRERPLDGPTGRDETVPMTAGNTADNVTSHDATAATRTGLESADADDLFASLCRCASADAPLAPGDVVGGCYEVRSLLGAGGMGYVYLAEDLILHRMVALKMARRGVPADSLRNEARVMAAFSHPGLPTIFGIGEHEGLEFLVMERIAGTTLAQHLDGQRPEPMPIPEVLRILLGVSDALAPLHDAGMVHRDLKPENVMLAGPSRIVVLDCGISCQERYAADERTICGSPLHIAPESITAKVRAGEAHLVDIYALGVIAFELLTLSPPFPYKNLEQLLWQHANVVPPRTFTLRPDVPVELDDLVAACLAKDPDTRPPTVQAISSTLRWLSRTLEVPEPRVTTRRALHLV